MTMKKDGWEVRLIPFVGHVSMCDIDISKKRVTLGFMIGRTDLWGKGIASRAVELMLHMLEDYGFDDVITLVHRKNTRSLRILSKLGFYERRSQKNATVAIWVKRPSGNWALAWKALGIL